MVIRKSRYANLFAELASENITTKQEAEAEEQRRQQQVWTEYCDRGLALASSSDEVNSDEVNFDGQEQEHLDDSEKLASAIVESVLESDINQQQDDVPKERVDILIMRGILGVVLNKIEEHMTDSSVGLCSCSSKRSCPPFRAELVDLKELLMRGSTPEFNDPIERLFEDLLLDVDNEEVPDSGESVFNTWLSEIPDSFQSFEEDHAAVFHDIEYDSASPDSLVSSPESYQIFEETRRTMYDDLDDLAIPSLDSLVNGPERSQAYGSGAESPRLFSDPLKTLSDMVEEATGCDHMARAQHQHRSSQSSSPILNNMEFDNQSQPDLQPKYFLPTQYRNTPTDKIEANFENPRFHAAQVSELLRPVPDLADLMNLSGNGNASDDPNDTILSRAPRAPRAMRAATPQPWRPSANYRYRSPRTRGSVDPQSWQPDPNDYYRVPPRLHRQDAYFTRAQIDARMVNQAQRQIRPY